MFQMARRTVFLSMILIH